MVSVSNLVAVAAQFYRDGALAEAEPLYRQALEHWPDDPELWVSLGQVCRGLGQHDEGIGCLRRALELRPDWAEVLNELGILAMQQGDLAAAAGHFARAILLRPELVEACNNLGLVFMSQGRLDLAQGAFERVLSLRPDLPEAHNNVGLAHLNQGRPEQARQCFEQALRLRPDMADAHNNLGLACAGLGWPDEALACHERAVQTSPAHFGGLTNLGNACKDQGRIEEAVAFYRRALKVRPDDARVHSNLLLALQYQGGTDPRDILAEARAYNRRHAAPLAGTFAPQRPRPLAGRRLRIGYVSADFREHPVANFLEPILAAHDHQQFEIIGYSDVLNPDAMTRRLQGYADQWRSLVGLSDGEAAEVIRRDEVDLLVDLAGHTGGNRLLVFARKPAPVQVSYLGYLGTTGLPLMDGTITDALADPPGLTEAHYQESLVRLQGCAFCYSAGPAPEVCLEPPASALGVVTFGCLNNLAKVSQEALALWARVLGAVPGSRLLLRAGAGRRAEEALRENLAGHGIVPERLLLAGTTATRFDYLTLYHAVDVGLDPLPYNGVTTTCDALWMGVPVVTLAGQTTFSRQGVRFLRSVGLDELVADSHEDYLQIAAELAGDRSRLAALRADLRPRMSRSPLTDALALARNLEAAYRGLWEQRAAERASDLSPS